LGGYLAQKQSGVALVFTVTHRYKIFRAALTFEKKRMFPAVLVLNCAESLMAQSVGEARASARLV
jgi:hypothetical protein